MRTGALVETRDGKTFLVQHKMSPAEEEEDLYGESGQRDYE